MTGFSEHKKQLVWTGRCLADLLTRLSTTVEKWAKDIEDEPSPFSTSSSTLRNKVAPPPPSQGGAPQPSDKPAGVEAPGNTEAVKPRSREPRNLGTMQPGPSHRSSSHPGFGCWMGTHPPNDLQLKVTSPSSTGSSCPIVDLVGVDAQPLSKKRQYHRRLIEVGANRRHDPAVVKGEARLMGDDISRQYGTPIVKRRRVRNDWTVSENAILYHHIQCYPTMDENQLVTRVQARLDDSRTRAQTKARFRYLLASRKIFKSDSTPPKWVLSTQLSTWLSRNGYVSGDPAAAPVHSWRRRYSLDLQRSRGKSESGIQGLLPGNRPDGSSDDAL